MILPHGQHRCEQTQLRTELYNLTELAGAPPCPCALRRCRSFAAKHNQQQRRCARLTARAEGDGEAEGSKGLFGFVTNNASSRSVRPGCSATRHAFGEQAARRIIVSHRHTTAVH